MYNFRELEQRIKAYWKKIKLLNELEKKGKGKKKFFLLDGPPYANAIPHVGHIRNTVYKDLYIKLKFMQNFDVFFQPGFDTHGLPIENKVEKELKLKSKKDIEKIGIGKFTKLCKKLAATNKDLWMKVYEMLGSWYSWKKPYLTYENSYLESGWWTFKKLWDKGLVYEGKKPVHWCPKCQTALAGYEVTDSYKMVPDPYILIKFKVKNKDEFLLVYTTTPWTLVSNVAIAAHPKEDYVKVETLKGVLILAKKRLEVLTDLGIGYKILDEFKGKKLNGLEYESIIDVPEQKELQKNKAAHKVYMSIPVLKERQASKVAMKKKLEGDEEFGQFVTVDEGTGLVHVAPGHGKTDNEFGEHYKLPSPSPLDDEGRFTSNAGEFSGMFVKDADKEILKDLGKRDVLLYSSTVEHRYPLCWRCKSPLIFRLSNQWFLKVKPIKEKMLEANKKVNWQPEFARERFKLWLLDAEDWNISRQRYWGIPLPIWKCPKCGEIEVIDSLKSLKKKTTKKIPKDFDLHNASNIFLKCKCGGQMKKVSDITDVWFDSGIATWAFLGYPFKNKKLFEEIFPVDRINEAQDQIRGWFYSLMFCGVAIFDKSPYKTVSMPGWVLDENGDKMSKSLGNVIFAKEALEELGADILRFYSCWDIAPSSLQRFSKETAKKEVGKIIGILLNIQKYLTSQTNRFEKVSLEKEDKWILSRLNSLIKDYTENLENFELHLAARSMANFIVDDLSRFYIHLIRERLSKDSTPMRIINDCLMVIVKLLAPITPYISEEIYQALGKLNKIKKSVHLGDWPRYNSKLIDLKLEEEMKHAQEVIQLILAEREKTKLGIRWPLPKATIYSKYKDLSKLTSLIKRQTNVKDVEFKQEKQGKLRVVLKTKLTKELEQEGFAREVIRRIQSMRKKAGLKKNDLIELVINSKYDLSHSKEQIKKKVGAKIIEFNKTNKLKFKAKEKIKGREFEIGFDVFKSKN